MYTASPFVRSVFSILASASIVAASFVPLTVVKAAPQSGPGYLITGTATPSGLQVSVSGQASANPYTGQGDDQHVSIDWNEDNSSTPSNSNGAWETVLNINASGGSFASTSWTGTHNYPASGPYKIFVRVHHAQPGGAESGSGTISFSVVLLPQCSDSIDNDSDGFIDYPADPGCTNAQDNTESPNPVTTATLTLQKAVITDNGGSAADTDWTLSATSNSGSISGTEGQAAITSALVNPGTYTLAETGGPNGYTASTWQCTGASVSGGNQITLAAGDSAICTITNDDQPASLTVTKVVNKNFRGTSDVEDFNLFVGIEAVVSGVSELFNAGPYVVTEQGPLSGYNAVFSGDCNSSGNITLALGETKTCTITNSDKEPGILHVIKEVENDNPEGYKGDASPSDFEITVTGGNPDPSSFQGSDTGVDVTIDAGASFSVAETGGPTEDYAMSFEGDCQGTMPEGGELTCTIINNDNPPTTGGLTVIKVINDDDGSNEEVSDFPLHVTDESQVVEDVVSGVSEQFSAGNYVVSETGMDGYNVSFDGDCDSEGNITIENGVSKTCTITNDDIAPTITLVKVVNKNNGGTATEGDFGLLVNNNPVDSGETVEVLANTSVTVNEVGLEGYTFVSITGEGCPVSLGGTVELNEGEDITCTITNDDDAPSLTLIKQISDVEEEGDASESDWTLTATGPTTISGEGGASSDGEFDAGSYNLTESEGPARYAQGPWICEINDGESVVGSSIEIGLGDDVICTVTNTFTPFSSDLSVDKTVNDSDPDNGQTVVYTIAVSNAGPDEATNVEVSDILPVGVTYVSDDSSGAYNSGTGVWTVGTLANGASATLNITVTVSASAGETVENFASVTSSTADPDSEDKSDSVSFTVNTPPSKPQCDDGIDNDGDNLVDYPNDLGCNSPSDDGEGDNNGGGGGGSFKRPSSGGGEVLGAATEECVEYLHEYIKKGANNNATEVEKLQTFLNNFEAFNLTVNGTYDDASYNAVHAFQTKYLNDIMIPWGATKSSGYVYYTTKKKINEIYCKFTKEFPLSSQQEAEIARVKAMGAAWTPAGGASTGSSVGGQVNLPTAPSAPAAPSAPKAENPEVGAAEGSSQAASPAAAGGSWWSNFWNWLTGN